MNLSFVYPIYNEQDNLPRLLPETRRIAQGLICDYEVILVDDGSTDRSGELIDEIASRCPEVRAIHHGRNRGLGAAITTGLSHASKEFVLYMDSDFPVSAEEARDALSQVDADTDLLIGYRLGRAEGLRREIMSWVYNRLIRWRYGLRVRDVNFAFKLIRRSILDQIRLRSEGSFIDAELLLEAARLGARIKEIGIHYHPRTAGASTAASARVVWRILGEMQRYSRRLRAGRIGPARLIVNADDFGLCSEVNRGIVEAYERGLVTSASLLPTGAAFDEAVALARSRPGLDLGLHLALTQTTPASPPASIPSLVDRSGRFPPDWRAFVARYFSGRVRREHVVRELRAQIARVQCAGLAISHLDSHQHVHMLPGLLPIVVGLAAEHGIGAMRYPRETAGAHQGGSTSRLRRRAELAALDAACRLGAPLLKRNGLFIADGFRGFSEAGQWNEQSLAAALADLDGGVTELCCHPGVTDGIEDRFPWGYRWAQELAALTSHSVAAAAAENFVTLTTYRECIDNHRR